MARSSRPPLMAIVGPTGVGKTSVAVHLCQRVSGEIVSADSRQVYKGLDIGTAKATAQQRGAVRHHLVDIVDPDEEFTLAQYQEAAYQAIDDTLGRGMVPFLVGGTGLYVRAVLRGFVIPRVEPDPQIRERLLRDAEEKGSIALHDQLKQVDPEAAARIEPQNVRRVARALEVFETTGMPISALQTRQPPDYRILRIGLTMERQRLYDRVDHRVDRMLDDGLVAEVEGLLAKGYGPERPAMSGLGYRQICAYLAGESDLPSAVRKIKTGTHRFVRQQYKWFRLDDETIHWFDMDSKPHGRIEALVLRFLDESS